MMMMKMATSVDTRDAMVLVQRRPLCPQAQ